MKKLLLLTSNGRFQDTECIIIDTGQPLPVVEYQVRHDHKGMVVVLTIPAHYVDLVLDTRAMMPGERP